MITSKEDLELIKETITNNLENQTLIKNTILKYTEELVNTDLTTFLSSVDGDAYKYLTDVQSVIQMSEENITQLDLMLEKINKIISSTNNIIKNESLDNNEFKENLETNLQNDVVESMEHELNKQSKDDLLNQNLVEDTLFISDIKQKVILPYKIVDLNDTLQNNNKYNNIQEIIDEQYTIPMSYYKNSSISRFKEAYNLIRVKSKGSIKSALDLGLELLLKSDLNPAIITACKNVDELDVYLACLEDNDIHNFKCFNIVYEALPTKINIKKK